MARPAALDVRVFKLGPNSTCGNTCEWYHAATHLEMLWALWIVVAKAGELMYLAIRDAALPIGSRK
jgi:hypothetical protein